MTPDEAKKEYLYRTFHLAAGGSTHYKLRTWDKKTPEWRAAQRELLDNICADLDRRKIDGID